MRNKLRFIKKVLKHKWYVARYCFACGLYWRGIKHDISKFHPIEFKENVKYYMEGKSSIVVCKLNNNGISRAWLHHKGHNDHHYEYWQDNFDKGTDHLHIPYKPMVELICDSLSSSILYNRTRYFVAYNTYRYYENMFKCNCAMCHYDKRLILYALFRLSYLEFLANGKLHPSLAKRVIGKKGDLKRIYDNNYVIFVESEREISEWESIRDKNPGMNYLSIDMMYYQEVLYSNFVPEWIY